VAINQPYYRIARPMLSDDFSYGRYVLDRRYASDRSMLCRAYRMLEDDLKIIFEFVEPSDDNCLTYSHRIYELLLRAATEFETNCKGILDANGYIKNGNLSIIDYYKIEKAIRASKYEIYLDIWRPERKKIVPFKGWATGHKLEWYAAYNDVKHGRQIKFCRANIANLLNSVAAVYIILFAQFGVFSFNPYQQINMVEDNDDGSIFSGESIFGIIPPSWLQEGKYDFDWEKLKKQPSPFLQYNF
jgi:hypothetical protein